MFNLSEYLSSAYDEAEENAEVTTTTATEDTTATGDTSATEDTTTTGDTSTTEVTTATEDTTATETVAAATNYVAGSSGNKSLDALLGIQSSTTATTANAFMTAVTNAGVTSSTAATTDTVTTSTTNDAEYVYTGGNQVISNYTSGESIILGVYPTGATFADGNFYLGTDSGTLVIQNAANKIIEFEDANENDIAKAYKATTAGLIDGRSYDGFEVIEGSNTGADLIFAGSDGSSLYGGAGSVSDTLIGGAGTDIFVSGKYQGTDVIGNAETKDIINIFDATLSDIVATNAQNGIVAVSFNNGNVIAVSSAQSLSAAFMLADGSAWRYNHATGGWQSA